MNTYWELISIYILSCFPFCSNRNAKLSVSFAYFIFGRFEFFQFIVHCMLGIERVIINPSTQRTLSRQLKIKCTTCKHTKKYKLFCFKWALFPDRLSSVSTSFTSVSVPVTNPLSLPFPITASVTFSVSSIISRTVPFPLSVPFPRPASPTADNCLCAAKKVVYSHVVVMLWWKDSSVYFFPRLKSPPFPYP